jgi:hypothetical protein
MKQSSAVLLKAERPTGARRHGRNRVQEDMAHDHLAIEARWQRYWDEHDRRDVRR